MTVSQQQLRGAGPLLNTDGSLADAGWSTQPVLDCNLENARFYPRLRAAQRLRIKRWDYYAVTTPTHFFSFTLGDIGYLGQVFAYAIDFSSRQMHEETLSIPFSRGIELPRNSTAGTSRFENAQASFRFDVFGSARTLEVDWPGFDGGKGLAARVSLHTPPAHESLVIVIPIRGRRFYYNRKMNCLPASGWVEWDGQRFTLDPHQALGNLDWGRGVWEYRSFWVWASASGFLPDGRTIGLNLGFGFGDTAKATENAFILDSCVHKLGEVPFHYDSANFMQPWRMESPDGRLALTFTPFFERVARTDFKVLSSEVHQMFGRYQGTVIADNGETITLTDLVGFAEEHHAKW